MPLAVLVENHSKGMWQNCDINTATICQAEARLRVSRGQNIRTPIISTAKYGTIARVPILFPKDKTHGGR